MQLAADLSVFDLPLFYEKFRQDIPPETWSRVAEKLRAEIRGNPLLQEYLHQRHRLIFALEFLESNYQQGRLHQVAIHAHEDVYEACSLIGTYFQLTYVLSNEGHFRLTRRITGSFRNAEDSDALAFELQLAINLADHDFKIEFPEKNEDSSPDFLAGKLENWLDIECKLITQEKGKKLKRREVLDLLWAIRNALVPDLDRVVGGKLVTCVVRGDKLTPHNRRIEVARAVAAVATGMATECEACSISVRPFKLLHGLPPEKQVEQTRSLLQAEGLAFDSALRLNGNSGAVIIAIEADSTSQFENYLRKTCVAAAKRQLSGLRPGILCLKMAGVEADALLASVREEGSGISALDVFVNELFGSESAKTISMLSVHADRQVRLSADHKSIRNSAVRMFKNAHNVFSNDPLLDDVFEIRDS